jgi:cell division protein FtsB
MSEILEEYSSESIKRFYRSWVALKLFLAALVVVGFGIYMGDLLFGKSSLDVLLGLQADKNYLQKRLESLKEENAALQKTYFELRQLDPDLYKE